MRVDVGKAKYGVPVDACEVSKKNTNVSAIHGTMLPPSINLVKSSNCPT